MSLSYDLPGNAKRLIDGGLDPALAMNAALRQHADILKAISTLRSFLETLAPQVTLIAATGNESARPRYVLDAGLPASELLAVGAVRRTSDEPQWSIADFSNARAEVVAPGVDVLSADLGEGWATMSGTSMATPHVAGVAALHAEKLNARAGEATAQSVRHALMTSASRALLPNADLSAVGAGIVQAP
jgi:subtilisin family serine protease